MHVFTTQFENTSFFDDEIRPSTDHSHPPLTIPTHLPQGPHYELWN